MPTGARRRVEQGRHTSLLRVQGLRGALGGEAARLGRAVFAHGVLERQNEVPTAVFPVAPTGFVEVLLEHRGGRLSPRLLEPGPEHGDDPGRREALEREVERTEPDEARENFGDVGPAEPLGPLAVVAVGDARARGESRDEIRYCDAVGAFTDRRPAFVRKERPRHALAEDEVEEDQPDDDEEERASGDLGLESVGGVAHALGEVLVQPVDVDLPDDQEEADPVEDAKQVDDRGVPPTRVSFLSHAAAARPT